MGKYRKKPVTIEAEIYTPGMEDGVNLDGPFIRSLEGDMTISPGDWIITGVKGERYPCKPDVFEMTYEKIL